MSKSNSNKSVSKEPVVLRSLQELAPVPPLEFDVKTADMGDVFAELDPKFPKVLATRKALALREEAKELAKQARESDMNADDLLASTCHATFKRLVEDAAKKIARTYEQSDWKQFTAVAESWVDKQTAVLDWLRAMNNGKPYNSSTFHSEIETAVTMRNWATGFQKDAYIKRQEANKVLSDAGCPLFLEKEVK